MNKEFAWLLGYLLSDGCINRPTYRGKGDETHLEFICKYDDREVLQKVKDILETKANIREYPDYKSPQAKIAIYDRKDIIEQYSNIKTVVPIDDIQGYERHFIRGLIDGDGCLHYRENRDILIINFINEYPDIVRWVTWTIITTLDLPQKNIRHIERDHIWSVSWEGNIARLIAYWLYHGDIDNCCLKRKRDKYKEIVLDNKEFDNNNLEMLYAIKAYLDENGSIKFKVPCQKTLAWCHRTQKLLDYNTVPVTHSKGTDKYYELYVPQGCH